MDYSQWMQFLGMVVVVLGGVVKVTAKITSLEVKIESNSAQAAIDRKRIEDEVLRVRESVDRRFAHHA